MLSDKKIEELKETYPCKVCGNVSSRHNTSCKGVDFELAYVDQGKELERIKPCDDQETVIITSDTIKIAGHEDYSPKFVAFRFYCKDVEGSGGFTIPAHEIRVLEISLEEPHSLILKVRFLCVCRARHDSFIVFKREM